MQTRLDFTFTGTAQLHFGAGKLSILHTLPMPGHKALVVVSAGKSVHENGSLQRTLHELQLAKVQHLLFDGVHANPTKEEVEAGAAMAVANGCDFFVALGGGSVLDATKVMSINATNPGDLWDYVLSGTGGRKPFVNAPLPWIAIPTTAGTGSEVDAAGVITNVHTKEKLGIAGGFARYAIVDPELMLTVPPHFTALQGFDALFHSLEGYISNLSNLWSDAIQEQAIRNVATYLPVAFRDGSNLHARTRMAYASTLSGYSMVTTSCTAEHAIEHALSAYHPALPHGAGLIMVSLAYFGTIIRQHVADDRFVRMAQWLGMEDATRPEDFLTALAALQRRCGVDTLCMSHYGITPDEFPSMARNAIDVMERCWSKDLQRLSADEIVAILHDSYR